MVTGASASDLAVLLVDARKGLLVQTRRHAAIASLLGIRQVVLAVNKMDLVGFDQAVFDSIVTDFYALLGQAGTARGDRDSGLRARRRQRDDAEHADAWYSGTTLLTALEGAEATSHVAERAFRMPVQFVARPDHTFRGYAGTVATGTIRPGATVVNAVSGTEAKVARIVTMDGDLAEAAPGEAVTLVLDREIDVSRGDVLAAAPPPALADQVTAWVVWMDETPLFRGRAYLFMLGSRSVVATITEITNRLDVDTLTEVPVRELALNEIGRVTISLAQRVACERYAVSRDLGGFILIDRLTRNTVGAGMVTDLRAGASNIHWHRLDVDKQARAGTEWGRSRRCCGSPGCRRRASRRSPIWWRSALHAQGRHTMSLDGDNVRHGAQPRSGVLRGGSGGEHPPHRGGVEAVRRGRADRAGVVHLAVSRGADAGARLRRGGGVPGDLRRYAGGRVPAARPEGAVPAGGCRADPELHRRGCAV